MWKQNQYTNAPLPICGGKYNNKIKMQSLPCNLLLNDNAINISYKLGLVYLTVFIATNNKNMQLVFITFNIIFYKKYCYQMKHKP